MLFQEGLEAENRKKKLIETVMIDQLSRQVKCCTYITSNKRVLKFVYMYFTGLLLMFVCIL